MNMTPSVKSHDELDLIATQYKGDISFENQFSLSSTTYVGKKSPFATK